MWARCSTASRLLCRRMFEAWKIESSVPLTEMERYHLQIAQALFHLTMIVPTFIYYFTKIVDFHPRFPATISWTIRQGPNKWLHHALWLCGWTFVLKSLWLRPLAFSFASQMVLVGVVATMLAPCGHSSLMDQVHYVAAALYISNHFVLINYLEMDHSYSRLFYSLMLFFFVAASAKIYIKKASGVRWAPNAGPEVIERKLQESPQLVRTKYLIAEIIEMICEFGLFVAFVGGMTSGPSFH